MDKKQTGVAMLIAVLGAGALVWYFKGQGSTEAAPLTPSDVHLWLEYTKQDPAGDGTTYLAINNDGTSMLSAPGGFQVTYLLTSDDIKTLQAALVGFDNWAANPDNSVNLQATNTITYTLIDHEPRPDGNEGVYTNVSVDGAVSNTVAPLLSKLESLVQTAESGVLR